MRLSRRKESNVGDEKWATRFQSRRTIRLSRRKESNVCDENPACLPIVYGTVFY